MPNTDADTDLIRKAMSALGRRSHQALRKRLGAKAYRQRMSELARRGGEAARGKSGRRRQS